MGMLLLVAFMVTFKFEGSLVQKVTVRVNIPFCEVAAFPNPPSPFPPFCPTLSLFNKIDRDNICVYVRVCYVYMCAVVKASWNAPEHWPRGMLFRGPVETEESIPGLQNVPPHWNVLGPQ